MKKVLLLLLLTNALMAQPSYHFDLLKDINASTNDAKIKFIKSVGSKVVIFQVDRDYNANTFKLKLWSYDGTRLKNFASMNLSHEYAGFTMCIIIDDYIFFHIDNHFPFALYVVKLDSPDIKKVLDVSYPPIIVRAGSKIYYSDHLSGVYYYNELTNESTKIQPENTPFYSAKIIFSAGNLFYFMAIDYDYPPYIVYTWVSDGTPEGTHKLTDAEGQTFLSYTQFGKAGNKIIFSANESVYSSDGTAAGTNPILNLNNFKSNPDDRVSLAQIYNSGNKAYLYIAINNNSQIWETDGTAANTAFFTTESGFCLQDNGEIASKDGFVFFINYQYKLAKTDGKSVKLLSDQTFYSAYEGWPKLTFNPADNSFYFNLLQKFYKTNGTTEGTKLISDKQGEPEGSTTSIPFALISNKILAYTRPLTNNRFGKEIYEINADTVKIVRDLDSTTKSSGIQFLLNAQGKSYFLAGDGEPDYPKVFETDGTPEKIKGVEVGYLDFSTRFFSFNKDLFLLKNNQFLKINFTANNYDEIKTLPYYVSSFNPIQLNNKVYFVLGNYFYDDFRELWVTDGTNSGTKHIRTFNDDERFHYFAVNNQELYFFTKSENTLKIWKHINDTTPPVLLKIINGTYVKTTYSGFRNKLAFLVNTTNSMELWVTDGTSNGTTYINSFPPRSNYELKNFFFTNNFYYYSDYTNNRTKVWKSDGTLAGTTLIADIMNTSSDAIEYCECNNTVFFGLNEVANSSMASLYKYHPATNTTTFLNTVGVLSNDNRKTFFCLKNQLYFSTYGNKIVYNRDFLYTSDGTPEGTKDIIALNPDVGPSYLYPLNDHELLANVYDRFYNLEWFTFRKCDNPTNLTGTTADSKIQSSSTFIESTENLTGESRVAYFAPKSITLKAGFSVDNSSVFKAEIKNRACTLRQ